MSFLALPTLAIPALVILSGCAGLTPPSAEKLAALPVVSYPDKPGAGEYVYKLPAGKPIDVRLRADGSALIAPVEQSIGASLAHDLYLHDIWASEDGSTWVRADKLIGVNLTVELPSYVRPGPGDLHLTVDRRVAR
jgi:hypothetical protein